MVYSVLPFTVAVCPFTSKGPSLQRFLKLFLREKTTAFNGLYHENPMFVVLFGWWNFVEFLGWWNLVVFVPKVFRHKKHQMIWKLSSEGNGLILKKEHTIRWNNNSFPTICQRLLLCSILTIFLGKKLAGSKGKPTCWGFHSSYHVYVTAPLENINSAKCTCHMLCQIGV